MTAAREHRRVTPLQMLDDVRELVGFMDTEMGAWLNAWADIETLLNDELVSQALAFMDQQSRVVMEGRR
jgi:hypothetical protein